MARSCRRRRSALQQRLKSLSSDTAIFDEKEVICWPSEDSVRYVEVDRVTTVWLASRMESFRVYKPMEWYPRCSKLLQDKSNFSSSLDREMALLKSDHWGIFALRV